MKKNTMYLNLKLNLKFIFVMNKNVIINVDIITANHTPHVLR